MEIAIEVEWEDKERRLHGARYEITGLSLFRKFLNIFTRKPPDLRTNLYLHVYNEFIKNEVGESVYCKQLAVREDPEKLRRITINSEQRTICFWLANVSAWLEIANIISIKTFIIEDGGFSKHFSK